jgi:hypothetical protein
LAGLIALGGATPAIVSGLPTNPTPDTSIVVEQEIPRQIAQRASEMGVDKNLALAIAHCESTDRQFENNKAADGTQTVLRGRHNPKDVGIFQINETYHLENSRKLGYDIYSIEGNIGYGLWLLKNEGAKHWKPSQDCWEPKLASGKLLAAKNS